MRLRIFLAAALGVFSGSVAADSIDINLNDDSIQAIYTSNWRAAEFNMGLLNNSDQNDWVASVGLLAMGAQQSGNTRIEGGLGGKIYYADVADDNVLALGLGGEFRTFPGNGPFGIGGYLYFAPKVVTALDGERFWAAAARVEFEVVRNTANLYLGDRKVRVKLEDHGRVPVESGRHAGVKIRF